MARPRSAVSRYKHRKNNDHLKVREAVLYARVSTPEPQREGYSIPAQVKLLEDYATLNGIAVVSSHVDVETARKSGRTAFGNMLRYLRRHPEVRIILVEKTDRLYRNLKDWATIDDLGVEVHFVKENVVMSDGCRSSEKFVHGIKVLMTKAYIDNLSEETRKGMIEHAWRMGYLYSEKEYRFLLQTVRKRSLSQAQLDWKRKINRRILAQTIVQRRTRR